MPHHWLRCFDSLPGVDDSAAVRPIDEGEYDREKPVKTNDRIRFHGRLWTVGRILPPPSQSYDAELWCTPARRQ